MDGSFGRREDDVSQILSRGDQLPGSVDQRQEYVEAGSAGLRCRTVGDAIVVLTSTDSRIPSYPQD